jgi:hypothetical protein
MLQHTTLGTAARVAGGLVRSRRSGSGSLATLLSSLMGVDLALGKLWRDVSDHID